MCRIPAGHVELCLPLALIYSIDYSCEMALLRVLDSLLLLLGPVNPSFLELQAESISCFLRYQGQ